MKSKLNFKNILKSFRSGCSKKFFENFLEKTCDKSPFQGSCRLTATVSDNFIPNVNNKNTPSRHLLVQWNTKTM